MDRLRPDHNSPAYIMKSIIVVLALAMLLWAIIALFYPIQFNSISGTLDSGKPFSTNWNTYAYNSIGGYLLLLAACIALHASFQLLKSTYSEFRTLIWACFCTVIVTSTQVLGDTLIINWHSFIPPEIQHAIDTPYVHFTRYDTTNAPALFATYIFAAYLIAILIYYIIATRTNRSVKVQDNEHAVTISNW